jgi:hypothetical protein
MMPHNSDPIEAFKQCCQQTCPLLYNSRLYKCSTAGLLEDTLGRFGNPNLNMWAPFIDRGIDANCSDQNLQEFLNNFGKPADICSQCPTAKDVDSQIEHLTHVEFKKKR